MDTVEEELEENNPMALIELRVVTRKGVVFQKIVADNIHNACWWMQENAEFIDNLWQEHINDEPRIQMEDVCNPIGLDL